MYCDIPQNKAIEASLFSATIVCLVWGRNLLSLSQCATLFMFFPSKHYSANTQISYNLFQKANEHHKKNHVEHWHLDILSSVYVSAFVYVCIYLAIIRVLVTPCKVLALYPLPHKRKWTLHTVTINTEVAIKKLGIMYRICSWPPISLHFYTC